MPRTATTPRLYYEVRGAGEPVLVIMGFGLSARVLAPLVAAGERDLRWITYDHPGIGRSDRSEVPWTTGRLAACAIKLADELQLDAFHVAGLSLGGAVALELALRYPSRLKSLILLGTTAAGPLGRGTRPDQLALVARRVAAASVGRRRLWFGPALYSPEYLLRRPPPAQVARHGDGPEQPSLRALLGQSFAASLHDRSRRLREIELPTLVVHGERDVLLPVSNARALAAGIPGAQLRILAGAGHAFALERPEEIAALLHDWTRRHAAPPP